MSILQSIPGEILRIIADLTEESVYDLRLTCKLFVEYKVRIYRPHVVNELTPATVLPTKFNVVLRDCLLMRLINLRHIEQLTLYGFAKLSQEDLPNLKELNIVNIRSVCISCDAPEWIPVVRIKSYMTHMHSDIPHNVKSLEILNSIRFSPMDNRLERICFRSEPYTAVIPACVKLLELKYDEPELKNVTISDRPDKLRVRSHHATEKYIKSGAQYMDAREARKIGNADILINDHEVKVILGNLMTNLAVIDFPVREKMTIISERVAFDHNTRLPNLEVKNIPKGVQTLKVIRCNIDSIPKSVKHLTLSNSNVGNVDKVETLVLYCSGNEEFDYRNYNNFRSIELRITNGLSRIIIRMPNNLLRFVTTFINTTVLTGAKLTRTLRQTRVLLVDTFGGKVRINTFD